MNNNKLIQQLVISIFTLSSFYCLAQKKELPKHEKEAIQFIYKGNQEITGKNPDVIQAEKAYRKAISKDPNNSTAKYNLGISYHATKNYQEAAQRAEQAAKLAKTNGEKNAAFYNQGNAHMAMNKPDEAIEAYKKALRNNPTDDKARYNLALAKQMKKEQDKNKDQNKDNKQNNKDQKKQDKKEGDKDDNKKNSKDNKENEDGKNKEDEKPNDDDKGNKENKEKEQPRKPVEGKLSPEQVKSLLEAMANEEKKVQDKINAQKVKGVKVKSDKDW